jgi:hypothetical protein
MHRTRKALTMLSLSEAVLSRDRPGAGPRRGPCPRSRCRGGPARPAPGRGRGRPPRARRGRRRARRPHTGPRTGSRGSARGRVGIQPQFRVDHVQGLGGQPGPHGRQLGRVPEDPGPPELPVALAGHHRRVGRAGAEAAPGIGQGPATAAGLVLGRPRWCRRSRRRRARHGAAAGAGWSTPAGGSAGRSSSLWIVPAIRIPG